MASRDPWTDEYVEEYVRRSRAEQGLPPKVEDEAFYDNLAVILTAGREPAVAMRTSENSTPAGGPSPEVRITATERFWANVEKGDGCWLWTGRLDDSGYGRFRYGSRDARRHVGAHKFAYETEHGPVADGLHIDHLCRVRNCVRPDHLEAVTPRENLRRSENHVAVQMAQETCVHGHPFDRVAPDGRRKCRTCERLRREAKQQAVAMAAGVDVPAAIGATEPSATRASSSPSAAAPQSPSRRLGRSTHANETPDPTAA